ncbi:hypothetical protein [Lysobacter terrae]
MNIWTGLLFLDGAVADVRLAQELAGDELAAAVPTAAGQVAADGLPPAAQPPDPSTHERAH